jgi:two-component system, cell cycle sensor histidine kinase and response regulator CckA
MQDLERLVLENEDWLMERALRYALDRGYTEYTSTLVEAWRLSIQGISEALVAAIGASDGDLELTPDDDYTGDPATAFGVEEARRHRERGIAPPMFLGLLKYYRQSYLDLVAFQDLDEETQERYGHVVHRFYDRLELGLCHEWSSAAAEAAQRLAEAQRIGRMGNWDWDIVGNGLTWSDEIYRIFGLQPQEFDASYPAFIERVHSEDRERVERAVTRAVRGEIDYAIDHRIVRPGGEVRTVHEQGEVYRDGDGQPVRMVGTVIDVTERRQLEDQVRQSQKMEAVGRLAGGVAHDFNNMLQAVLMHLGFAGDELATPEQRAEDLEEIRLATEKATQLTRQLLVFSRRSVLHFERVDLDEVIEEMLKMLSRVIGAGIELHYEPSADLGTVRADRSQLEQVVLNLCLNARDAMPDGGELVIDLRNCFLDEAYRQSHPWVVPGPMVQLSISDTGCGMTEDVQAQVFEPFFTTKGPHEGTGLGLATAWGVVKQPEGMIHLYSEPGRGTAFRIYLPLDETPDETWTGSGEESVYSGGHETLLVAEDDEAIRKALVRGLERAGYGVVLASDGLEAQTLFDLHRDQIALALLDVVMPGASGRDVHDHIRQTSPELPVLFSSGYSSTSIHKQQILERRMELIEKPYDMRELLVRVREILDRAH